MLSHKELKVHYAKMRPDIKRRLKEFAEKRKHMDADDLFLELCFCICTPQSKALRVAQVVNKKNLGKLMAAGQSELAGMLRTYARFHNNKARHIIIAREFIPSLKSLPSDAMTARELLVKNVKGIGYKEASHYLRNIGYRNLCIIDRHVIGLMHELGVFSNLDTPATAAKYLIMEQQVRDYAAKHGYDVDELDLTLWSMKTGYVFK